MRSGPPGALAGRHERQRFPGPVVARSDSGQRPGGDGVLAGQPAAAAGLMEVFAHGQGIADAPGARRVCTDRVGRLAWFGVHTKDVGDHVYGQVPPREGFRLEVAAPSGATTWVFGPQDGVERVAGPAAVFALLVSRRRPHADLAVRAPKESGSSSGWASHRPTGGRAGSGGSRAGSRDRASPGAQAMPLRRGGVL